MTVYYVDDGGSNTSPYDTWAKAAPTVFALSGAVTLASGDIVYVGHDSVCAATGNPPLTGPATGSPVQVISATQGSSPVEYQAGAEIGTNTGFYLITGIVKFNGITLAGTQPYCAYSTNGVGKPLLFSECTLKLATSGVVDWEPANSGAVYHADNLSFDLSNDGTTDRSNPLFYTAGFPLVMDFRDISFVNAGYRTGVIFPAKICGVVRGVDFSGFTNATSCEIKECGLYDFLVYDSKTAATWVPFSDRPTAEVMHRFVNTGSGDSRVSIIERTNKADLVSTSTIYRTSGAEIESIATAWLITTESNCSEASPYKTPWMVGALDTTGSKTFTVYVTNDGADFTDAEAWLEVEYLATSGSSKSSISSDHRVITATPAAQTDDTTSTWNGAGPSFTYKQKLAVTATVGQAGQYRARVVVGKASIASSAYFYVDPLVTIT